MTVLLFGGTRFIQLVQMSGGRSSPLLYSPTAVGGRVVTGDVARTDCTVRQPLANAELPPGDKLKHVLPWSRRLYSPTTVGVRTVTADVARTLVSAGAETLVGAGEPRSPNACPACARPCLQIVQSDSHSQMPSCRPATS
jgi:hypothetical protein